MSLRRQLVLSLLLLVVVVLSAVAVYMWFGGPEVTLLDAFYMAVITVTTVGYGEIVDTHSHPGCGFSTSSSSSSASASCSTFFPSRPPSSWKVNLTTFFGDARCMKLIRDMHDHLIICGAGETGTYLVKELLKTGNVFVVIDHDEERLDRISQLGEVPVLKGEGGDEEVLTAARIHQARGLASVLPEDKDNLLTTVTARLLNPNLRIVARCAEARMVEKLLRHGANAAISPNMIGGMRLASELIRPSVVSFLDMMLRDQSGTMRVEEIAVLRARPGLGKS